jgi:exosortase D (VPLPA-CTERM-specific)
MKTRILSPSLFKWLPVFLLYTILIFYYWPILYILGDRLAKDENYSFGLLLPFVIAYIIYGKWPQIQRTAINPTWIGLIVMFIGFGLNFIFAVSRVSYLGYISLFLVIIGLLLLQGGFRLIRVLAFPIVLFFIMLPLPLVLVKAVTFRLQIFSSFLAAKTLQGLGYPVFLQGNVIDLGIRQLQIVEACSGLGYLISALVLGIIFCYFYQRRLWKVLILLISVVPATVLANALRLVCIAFFPFLQAGFWHMAIGMIIFILVFLCLSLNNWLLNKLSPPPIAPSEMPAIPESSPPDSRVSHNLYNLAGLALVILAVTVTLHLGHTQSIPLVQDFDRFPLKIGPWEGSRGYVEPAILEVLGTNEYFEGNYFNRQYGQVSLWIAYYPDNYKEKGVPHNPETCMVGGGWKIVSDQEIELAPNLPVRKLLMERSGMRQVVYYWFLQNNQWVSGMSSLKIYLTLDAILNRRNNGALIRLSTPVNSSVEEAQERLGLFADSLLPALREFFHVVKGKGSALKLKRAAGSGDNG